MRLFNTTIVVLAAVLLASGTAVSKTDSTSVSNMDVVHSSHVLAGEDKRFLRSHQTTDESKITEHDEEEREGGANLFSALKLHAMGKDVNYRSKVFQRWKNYGYTVDGVAKEVPESLLDAYKIFLNKWPNTGWTFPARPSPVRSSLIEPR
ncbi:unnamed protein product [Phytophthora fragariaefolia]|uniref:RxLR effector protein n=1 Tax=Phytophthora fragariaefolia TaxID=1490495 RepID=A0A9W6XV39_9STRA|nr:unnamed protein product [Phytophthora fragariaefolia]